MLAEKLRKKYPHHMFVQKQEWGSTTIVCSNGRTCKLEVVDLFYYGDKTWFQLAEERLGLRTKIKWFKKA